MPLKYLSGTEICLGDKVLLHNQPGEIELVLDGASNPPAWPADKYGRGILIAEPKVFGRLFLSEEELRKYEDLVFISRAPTKF